MLVITRRPHEKIVFPSVGISIQVLKLTRGTVRVGVEAPAEIKVLRDEICPTPVTGVRLKADHALANALNKVGLAVHLARKQWSVGQAVEAEATLDSALKTLETLGHQREAAASVQRFRALIVDDDANERELLAGLLGMNGCECMTAADGEEALARLNSGERPDVVLLDMAMPRCDGPETLRRIRADDRYSTVRVYSVSSTPPAALNVPEGPTGFDGWFPKPLNPIRLWDAIQDAVRSPATAN